VERNVEDKRERYLTADELARLTAALDAYPDQQAANAFRLLLLTGARSGEVFSAEWHQFDLEAGRWTKSSAHTKQKKQHVGQLSPPARELLQRIRASQDEAERFVFPSSGASGHIVAPRAKRDHIRPDARVAGGTQKSTADEKKSKAEPRNCMPAGNKGARPATAGTIPCPEAQVSTPANGNWPKAHFPGLGRTELDHMRGYPAHRGGLQSFAHQRYHWQQSSRYDHSHRRAAQSR
jgi:hypothetical protein